MQTAIRFMLLDFINSLILTKQVTIMGEYVDYWPSRDHARSSLKLGDAAVYSTRPEKTAEFLPSTTKRVPAVFPWHY